MVKRTELIKGKSWRIENRYYRNGSWGGESFKYAGSDNLSEVAWYGYYDEEDPNRTITREETKEVCTKKTNGYGLCDMSGNVYEWVWDRAGEYSDEAVINPKGPTKGSDRVARGGSWVSSNARFLRVAYRRDLGPSNRLDHFGIRFSRTSP